MSKLDWGVGIAAVVAVGLFSYWGINGLAKYHHNNNERYQEVSNEKPSEPSSYICSLRMAPFSISCSPIATDGTTNTDKATKYDLNAQQDMAFAAFGVLFATCVGLIASGVTIFFVIRTLNETRQTNIITKKVGDDQAIVAEAATREAKRQSDAAWRSIELITAENRPWISFTCEPGDRFALEDGRIAINLNIVRENIGKSPAYVYFPVMVQIGEIGGLSQGDATILIGQCREHLRTRFLKEIRRSVIFPDKSHRINVTAGRMRRAPFLIYENYDGKLGAAFAIAIFYGRAEDADDFVTMHTFRVLGDGEMVFEKDSEVTTGKWVLMQMTEAFVE